MKIAWLTDIHLNFLCERERQDYYDLINEHKPDAIFITGDIAEAPSVSEIIQTMIVQINAPIYFVLGNHDFYRSSIDKVKEKFMSEIEPDLSSKYLPYNKEIELQKDIWLVGIDGMADGQAGDFFGSTIQMNDHRLIEEFNHARICSKALLLDEMKKFAEWEVFMLHTKLLVLFHKTNPKTVIILTHVPPFEEVCLYKGEKTQAVFLPFYCSVITGFFIKEFAKKHPNTNFLVLSGHTHSKAKCEILPNLKVWVGPAEYGNPGIEILQIKESEVEWEEGL